VSRLARGRIAVVAGAWIVAAAAANGCISNGAAPLTPGEDAAIPGLDAGEDTATPGVDAASDAGGDVVTVDASGRDAAPAPSQVGLVAAGGVSRSPSYVLSGTMGPGTAPVLRSTHYQFVGGMAVSAQKP
jgi:hypothetical protein